MPSELRDGSPLDGSAARDLDERYRGRLCRLVEREMNRRFRRREDPEDVVQSAFRTFYRRNARGEFRIDSSADLWRLLETITRHKMLKHVERLGTAKRDPKREEYPEGDGIAGQAPMPDEAAVVADLVERTLDGLDASYVAVFDLRLQRHSEEEIAAKLDCTRAAVRTRLSRIRERLERFGLHATRQDDRQPVDPAVMLRRCLEMPVGEYLEAGSPPGEGENVGADASMTLEGLFRTASPPPELLAAVKRQARRMMTGGGSGLPVEVQQVVYFGSIAAATVRRGERITAPADGKLGYLFLTVMIESGWHICSITQPPGGPMATKIEVSLPPGVGLAGKFQPSVAPEIKKKPVFENLPIEIHHGTVTWYAPIEVAAGFDPARLEIRGKIMVQACKANSCLPAQDLCFLARLGPGIAISSPQATARLKSHDAAATGEGLTMSVVGPRIRVVTGEELTYEIKVTNNGSTRSQQLGITATVPESMLFRPLGTAPAKFAVDGKAIRFEKVSELRPGDSLIYRVRVQTRQPGRWHFRAELTTAALARPIVQEASTEVF